MPDVPQVTTDFCVLCAEDTEIPHTESRDRRLHYIEGAGQLCRNCCHILYPHHCKCATVPFGIGVSASGRIVIG